MFYKLKECGPNDCQSRELKNRRRSVGGGGESNGRAEAAFNNGRKPAGRELLRDHAFAPLSVALSGQLLFDVRRQRE